MRIAVIVLQCPAFAGSQEWTAIYTNEHGGSTYHQFEAKSEYEAQKKAHEWGMAAVADEVLGGKVSFDHPLH